MLWYYTPMALPFSRDLRPRCVVYDCMDELSAFAGAPSGLAELEAELLERADVVFTGGQSLYQTRRHRHPNIHAFPSGVDTAHFGLARQALPEPADQRGIPRPRLGFAGVIDERMDIDLLCARLPRDGLFACWLDAIGIGRHELDWFDDNHCPPDIVGVNHYLSGERFLDHRVELHALHDCGGNGRDRYADVLAARMLARGADGPAAVLREAWQRYRLPLAVTEAHNTCTRDEQLRWLAEVWDAAE